MDRNIAKTLARRQVRSGKTIQEKKQSIVENLQKFPLEEPEHATRCVT